MNDDWQAMNDNQLRAHLEGALREREAHDAPQDCGYTEREFLEIARETVRRRLQAAAGASPDMQGDGVAALH